MIRYPVKLSELEEAARRVSPDWLDLARKKIEHFREVGRYDEEEGNWGKIKDVFMELQHSKCAYCERRLAGPPFGNVEHDIEHFRPKSSVKAWPTAKIAKERKISYSFPTGDAADPGYYLLAYSLLNYATACKTCNTPLKGNYFPLAGVRNTAGEDPTSLSAERAFLIYPLGSFDADPENVLTFDGTMPVPVVKTGEDARRAQVIIDFFELDTREELIRERAKLIEGLWLAHRLLNLGDPEDQSFARQSIHEMTSEHSPHTSCVKSFQRLIEEDPARAKELARAAQAYLDSQS